MIIFEKITFKQVILLMTMASLWLLHTSGDKLGGDGHDYFLYCRNLFFYGDLRYHTEDHDIADERFHQNMKNGILQTPFPIGPALAWLPFYATAHAVTIIDNIWHKERITGFERNYGEFIGYGTVIYVFIGLYILYLFLLQLQMPGFIAGLAVSLAYLGTFLINYTIFESSMSHGLSFFFITLFLYLWFRWRAEINYKKYLLLGFALGGAILMRYSNAVFIFIPLFDLIIHFNWNKLFHSLAIIPGTMTLFSLQMITWKVCFGKFILIPQGESYMQWFNPKWMETLFSSCHGLFSSHALIPLGLISYVVLARRKKLDVAGVLATSLALLYINAATRDWYAGHAFGARRFDALLPFVIMGLAFMLQGLESLLARKQQLILTLISGLFIIYNLFYLDYYRHNTLKRDRVITPIEILSHSYEKTGSFFNLPANLYLSLRYHIPLGKSEILLGNYIDHSHNSIIDPAINTEYLIDGWEQQVMPLAGCSIRRIKENRARVAFALFETSDTNMKIKFVASKPQILLAIKLRLNDHDLGSYTIYNSEVLQVSVSRSLFQQPFNILTIEAQAPEDSTEKIAIRWIKFL